MRWLLISTLLLTSSAALAQAPAPAPAPAAKKKKVIRLDALTVEGRIQKPQAFYILQRSTLNFDELNRAESFIPKVENSVEKDAF
ncbi:MAG: hypothetical protein H6Q89_1302 [Myxococcaceae bacterium]|nr:hypothetical protein [Myxococcaceae bacterium]